MWLKSYQTKPSHSRGSSKPRPWFIRQMHYNKRHFQRWDFLQFNEIRHIRSTRHLPLIPASHSWSQSSEKRVVSFPQTSYHIKCIYSQLLVQLLVQLFLLFNTVFSCETILNSSAQNWAINISNCLSIFHIHIKIQRNR